MILYFIIAILSILFLFMGYIRVKYQFWARQPVFHYYDIYYWFNNAGVIEPSPPEKNKYYNYNIVSVNELTTIQTDDVIQFIQSNYITNKDNHANKFTPTINEFVPYFTSHNKKCVYSILKEPKLLQENKTANIVTVDKTIGFITSRPLHVSITKDKIDFTIYYVDYLCVDKMHRQKGIAPQLIQTHEYNQRHGEPTIKVSLFKREDELTGIVPICAYDTYGFSSEKWFVSGLTPVMLKCDKQNIYHLFDFIQTNKLAFDLTILLEMGPLIELVASNNVIIYMQMDLASVAIQSVYFFRKSCTYVNDKEEVLACFASIQGTNKNEDFVRGFKTAVCEIQKEYPEYKYVSIERISHNGDIIDNLVQKTPPHISKTAYFFYNFAYQTFKSENVLILN
jgi:hypothetical protein